MVEVMANLGGLEATQGGLVMAFLGGLEATQGGLVIQEVIRR